MMEKVYKYYVVILRRAYLKEPEKLAGGEIVHEEMPVLVVEDSVSSLLNREELYENYPGWHVGTIMLIDIGAVEASGRSSVVLGPVEQGKEQKAVPQKEPAWISDAGNRREMKDRERHDKTVFWLMVFTIICSLITIAVRIAEFA